MRGGDFLPVDGRRIRNFLQRQRTTVLDGIEDSGPDTARALKIRDQETAPLGLAGHLDSDK